MKLIQPPSYASLRSKLNDPRAKAGLPPDPERPDGAATRGHDTSDEGNGRGAEQVATKPTRPAAQRMDAPPAAPQIDLAETKAPGAARRRSGSTAGRKVYKFRVPIPVATPGSEFTKLIEAYGAADAMGMILASALEAWVARYGAGTLLLDQPSYPTSGGSFGTSRRFEDGLVLDVRRRIDPYDRRADGFIAQRIAVSALSDYLKG
jgi:hypothetical protein